MRPWYFLTRYTVKNGISNLYILLKSALKMQEMPFQRPKFQKLPGGMPRTPLQLCRHYGLPLTKILATPLVYTEAKRTFYNSSTDQSQSVVTVISTLVTEARVFLVFYNYNTMISFFVFPSIHVITYNNNEGFYYYYILTQQVSCLQSLQSRGELKTSLMVQLFLRHLL